MSGHMPPLLKEAFQIMRLDKLVVWRKEQGLWNLETWFGIPVGLLTGWVTLGELFNLPELEFSHISGV